MKRLLSHPVTWGAFATFAVFAFGGWMAGVEHYDSNWQMRSNWQHFMHASPNEIGDTLAGFAGALAFVWIIVTVWLQSRELAAQREELRMTREELVEQRKATQEMAHSMSVQAEALEFQFAQSKEEKTFEVVKELLEDIFEYAKALREFEWYRDAAKMKVHPLGLRTTFHANDNWEAKLSDCANAFDRVEAIVWRCEKGEMFAGSHRVFEVSFLANALDEVAERVNELPEAIQYKLNRARFSNFHRSAKLLNETAILWTR